jgi:hypothetical protein
MNRIASPRISDRTLGTHPRSQMCSTGGALYAMWPISPAGSQWIYAIAFAAARQRVEQQRRIWESHPSMN